MEFVADDATRSDPAFLYDAVRTAIAAGAATVTVCDTAGAMLPNEFTAFIRALYAAVPELKDVVLGVACSDQLSMADSCAMAAVRYGAGEIKAAAYTYAYDGANTATIGTSYPAASAVSASGVAGEADDDGFSHSSSSSFNQLQ